MQVVRIDEAQKDRAREAWLPRNRVLLERWAVATELEERVQQYEAEQRVRADGLLTLLFATPSEGDARQLLSSLSQGTEEADLRVTDVMVDLLAQRCVATLQEGGETAQHLVDWMTLVAEFTAASELNEAHARFLEGAAASIDNKTPAGLKPWGRALQLYEQLGASRSLQAIASLALAEQSARHDDVTQARTLFDKAAELALAGEQEWAAKVYEVRDAWYARWRIVDVLDGDPPAIERAPVQDADWDVWLVLTHRALGYSVRGHAPQAVAAARLADRISAALGTPGLHLLSLAEIALAERNYVMAEALARAAGESAPSAPSTTTRHSLLARALQGRGYLAEAEQEARVALRELAESPDAYCVLAGILIESRKLDEALACLGSAVALDPQHSGAADILSWLSPAEIPGAHLDLRTNRFYVAQELLDAGPERAATYMSAALIRATPSAAVDVLASLENEKGSEFTAEVRRVLFPVLRAQLDVQHSHLEEAEALFQARRFDEATVEYTAATRDNPSDGAAWMGIGDCYYHLGKFNLATAFFEESVLLRPDAPTYLFLGDAHLKGGRFSGAREAYQAALNVNPNYDFAHRRLVELDRQMTNAQ